MIIFGVSPVSRSSTCRQGNGLPCRERPLERWMRLHLPDGPMAQDFEPVRRSRASMTVGQTSIS